MIDIALYQPDIAPNAASIIRLGACLGAPVHIIEPAGFRFSARGFRRAGMDYVDLASVIRHDSWAAFVKTTAGRRLVLASTTGEIGYADFAYARGDIIVMGRESAGVPEQVRAQAHASVRIDMVAPARSLNVALAAAMIAGEALRQLGKQ